MLRPPPLASELCVQRMQVRHECGPGCRPGDGEQGRQHGDPARRMKIGYFLSSKEELEHLEGARRPPTPSSHKPRLRVTPRSDRSTKTTDGELGGLSSRRPPLGGWQAAHFAADGGWITTMRPLYMPIPQVYP